MSYFHSFFFKRVTKVNEVGRHPYCCGNTRVTFLFLVSVIQPEFHRMSFLREHFLVLWTPKSTETFLSTFFLKNFMILQKSGKHHSIPYYKSKCTVGKKKKKKKKKKQPYLFQYKLSYRNETGTHHHESVSTWGIST